MWTITSSEGVVVTDGFDRLIVIYPDELSALGVTRVRLVDGEDIPVGTDEVVFIPGKTELDDGKIQELYYPMNSAGKTFYPVVCTYKDEQPSKVFLTEDVDAGIKVLMGVDVKYSITGGVVDDCVFLPLIKGLGSDDGS